MTNARISRRSFVSGLVASGVMAGALVSGVAHAAEVAGSSAKDGERSARAASASSAKDAASSSAADAAAFPVTITHVFGETVIERAPERVATLEWGNQDAVLALGVAPVGCSAANFGVKEGEKLLPWTREAFADLGVSDPNVFDDTDGYDFEAVSDCRPDLILAPYGGMTAEDYAQFTKIAPTVTYPTTAWATPWRDQIRITGRALGREREAAALVASLEATIADEAAAHGVSGQNVAFFSISATDLSTIYIYVPNDPRCAYLEDLGFTTPKSVRDLTGDTKDFYIQVSAEEADRLSDVACIVTYGDDAFVDQLRADPLLSLIPAIADGRVVALDGTSSLAASVNPTALSMPATIDEYLGLIQKALEK